MTQQTTPAPALPKLHWTPRLPLRGAFHPVFAPIYAVPAVMLVGPVTFAAVHPAVPASRALVWAVLAASAVLVFLVAETAKTSRVLQTHRRGLAAELTRRAGTSVTLGDLAQMSRTVYSVDGRRTASRTVGSGTSLATVTMHTDGTLTVTRR